jgi:CBS domain-containing protein
MRINPDVAGGSEVVQCYSGGGRVMEIGELCSREVYVVTSDEPLVQAVREMDRRHIGTVVVVEAREKARVPIGIVTDRDVLCGQLKRHADLFTLTVQDVMTPDQWTIAESCGVAEAITGLRARGVRRAPVVSDARDLVGIVSLDDLLPVVAENLSSLAKLIGKQAGREA